MEKLKLTIPESEIESGAMEQIHAALKLPFLKKLAIMPDVHQGYDFPIGAVALLDGYIWPGAVGYDIGCGMCFLNTRKNVEELFPNEESKKTFSELVYGIIPTGFEQQSYPVTYKDRFPGGSKYAALSDAVRHKAEMQWGTLGGGNHFIEIGVNLKQEVGITIHSGSRRPGWLIGDFYMRMTGEAVKIKSEIGQAYLKDMNWALNFALSNRMRMMKESLIALRIYREGLLSGVVSENHNHAVVTKDGVLHRKGATPAEKGQIGIIPANMRDGVWITSGLGNADFLNSASHGAGRIMSRSKAKKTLSHQSFIEQMEGIVAPTEGKFLDEAPEAYKQIGKVLSAQQDILIDCIDHFKPLIVIKG